MDATKRTGTRPSRRAHPRAGVNCPSQTPPNSPLSAEQVYCDYAPRVYNVARRMLRSDVDAEDVTQDVLLKVVRKLPSFRGESAFPTWLHRITVTTALSHRRKQAVRDEHSLPDSPDALPGDAGRGGPVPQLVGREVRQLIERAIADLPPPYRTVFVLSDVEGLPNAAIAQTLGLSLPAIKSRLHRARMQLRTALAPHFDGLTS